MLAILSFLCTITQLYPLLRKQPIAIIHINLPSNHYLQLRSEFFPIFNFLKTHFRSIIVLLAAATAVQSFTIPEGTPNSVYKVYTDEHGLHVHEQIVESSPEQVRRSIPLGNSAKFSRQDSTRVECGDFQGLNHDDANAANAEIDCHCGGGNLVPANHNFYAIPGNTVAFVCNFAGDNWSDAGTRGHFSSWVSSCCGLYSPGCVTVGNYISYGFDHSWPNFTAPVAEVRSYEKLTGSINATDTKKD